MPTLKPSLPKRRYPLDDEPTRRAAQTVCMALILAIIAVTVQIIAGHDLFHFPNVHFDGLRSYFVDSAAEAHISMALDVARLLLFPALMAFAAVSDLLTMTISNRVSLLLVAGFLTMALLSGMSLHDMLLHAGAGLAVLLVAFTCFAMGWVGGGDAKVAAASALWFGFGHLLDYLVYASLFGGALTLLLLQFRQWPMPALFYRQDWLLRLHGKNSGIPYGIALALGALLIYPETDWARAIDLTHFALQ